MQFVTIESGNQNILRTLSTWEFKFLSIQSLSQKYYIFLWKTCSVLKLC